MIDYHNFTTIKTSKEERRKLYVGNIYCNQARCLLCNDVIRSKNRHDFVTCKCGNLSVDGGSWYIRRGFKQENSWEELSVYYEDI